MPEHLQQLADDLWSVRGSFKTFGLLDIGTHCNLVRRRNGAFLMLDAYTLTGAARDQVMALTSDGRDLEAVVHLHPFHTVHVRPMAAMFPNARQFGTLRHHQQAPELAWEPERTEDAALHALFAEDLRFTVPRGVDFVSANPKLHFSSVLAVHPSSASLIVDDTLTWISLLFLQRLSFHPSFASVLERRAGAAADFRAWAGELIDLCADVTQVVPAHVHLPPRQDAPGVVADQIRGALARVEPTLRKHEARFG